MIDWPAILREWASLKRPFSEFWELSFYEVQLVFEGEGERLKREAERDNHLIEAMMRSNYHSAYVNALLAKVDLKRFPDFQKLNPLRGQEPTQSVETQISNVKNLHAVFGGELKINGVLQ